MKNKNLNTELPLFESDNYKRNFPEDFEGEISTIVDELLAETEE